MYLFGLFISLSIHSLICLFLYLYICLYFIYSFIIGLLHTRLISKSIRTLNDAERNWMTNGTKKHGSNNSAFGS
jgi:hypothetical protein